MLSRSPFQQKILKFPYRGAPSTVGVIRDAALQAQEHYHVRELAEWVCKDIQQKDYVSEPMAICYFIAQQTRYARDPRTVELVRSPQIITDEILRGKKPSVDCDDSCGTICAMCLSMGSRMRVITLAFQHVFYKGERQYSHVASQAQDPRSGKWITLDPVAGPKTKDMLGRAVAVKIWEIA